MTNSQIIFNESMELMKNGIINSTGRKIEVVNAAGEKLTVDEPEQIHTYAMWKQLGFQVKKGSKAVASFTIWKCTSKPESITAKNDKGEEVTITEESKNMFMKKSSFFTFSQVEKIATA